MLLHSLVCSLSFSPSSPPLSSMSLLTNCTYPISPWCEGHRTRIYSFIHSYSNDGHHSSVIMFFFLLSLKRFFCMSNLVKQSDRHIHEKKQYRKNFITKICRYQQKNHIHKMSEICQVRIAL